LDGGIVFVNYWTSCSPAARKTISLLKTWPHGGLVRLRTKLAHHPQNLLLSNWIWNHKILIEDLFRTTSENKNRLYSIQHD
jgi:hypothetical protein